MSKFSFREKSEVISDNNSGKTITASFELREIIWAKLHAPIFIPPKQGAKGGNYKDTLDANTVGSDIKMFKDGYTLLLKTQGLEVGIPLSNVINYIYKK